MLRGTVATAVGFVASVADEGAVRCDKCNREADYGTAVAEHWTLSSDAGELDVTLHCPTCSGFSIAKGRSDFTHPRAA
jgi:site-specific DNA-cytosine methylase